AAVVLDNRPRKSDDVPGLCPVKPDRPDSLSEPFLAERRHLLWRVGDREQGPRGLVDAGVRRLRRQHDRDQEREGVEVFELALRQGIGGGQSLEDRLGPRRPRLPRLFSRHRRFIGTRGRSAKTALAERILPGAAPPSMMATQARVFGGRPPIRKWSREEA